MYTEYKSFFLFATWGGLGEKTFAGFPGTAIFQRSIAGVPCPAFAFTSSFLRPQAAVFPLEGEGNGANQIE
jgi:hypothetical protein